MKTEYQGIDYGLGKTNISSNGIRYGVISHHEIGQAWYDESEPEYGEPTCPECGSDVIEYDENEHENLEALKYCCWDHVCTHCGIILDSDDVFPEEPSHFTYINGEYKCFQSYDDSDIFVEKSPYFTYAQFCSPCAPGAVYLMNPLDHKNDNNKGYCFGPDWFENGEAPYPIYDVKTGKEVTK